MEWTQQNHFWFLTLVKLVEAENVRFKDKNVISEIRTDFVLILRLHHTLRLKHVFEV